VQLAHHAAMRKPRRIWLLAGVFALLLGVTAWRFFSPFAQPSVALTFLGYTNVLVPESSAAYRIALPVALVLATNTGPVAVEVMAATSPKNFVTNGRTIRPTYDFCTVRNLGAPQFLSPGESVVLEIMPRTGSTSWQIELAYHARSTQKQILRRISRASNQSVRQWVEKIYRSPEIFWAELGPFTDLPPAVVPETKARKPQMGRVVGLVGTRQPSTNWTWLSTPARTNEVLPPPPAPDYSDGLRFR